jgi:beta-lactam-binding protein with PASTA domain
MASSVIRRAWFGRATANTMTVPPSGVGPPQVSEAQFLTTLAGLGLKAGTRTTQAAGAVLAGNVVSSTPAGGATALQGSSVAYLVSV